MEYAAKIDHEVLRRFARDCFEADGFSEEDARMGTDVLVWASLRGVETHGIRNLKRYYVDAVGGVGQRDGVILPSASLSIDREDDSSVAFNANGMLGLAASVKAMQATIEKARAHGLATSTVRNSTHFGPAGYYAHMAIAEDMIGFASTGYLFPLGQHKAVLPFGGVLPMLSTNPIAMACPAGDEADFVFDSATSVVPVNRVELYEEQGKPIPDHWARDKSHQPTTDPDEVASVNPLGGATEFGGYKGYGFALCAWIMTSLLSGGWKTDPPADRILGRKETTPGGFAQEGVGHSFAAIRIDRFVDVAQFKAGMDDMIRSLNTSPSADGVDRVLTPGQKAAAAEQDRRANGIPLAASTLGELRELAEKFGLTLKLLEE